MFYKIFLDKTIKVLYFTIKSLIFSLSKCVNYNRHEELCLDYKIEFSKALFLVGYCIKFLYKFCLI